MSELKPCPFCGGTEIHVETLIERSRGRFIPFCCYECLTSFYQQEDCAKKITSRHGTADTRRTKNDTLL